jgi:hypothetical protein
MHHLVAFDEDLLQLMGKADVKSEFEMYTGLSSDNDILKNDFGKRRLA